VPRLLGAPCVCPIPPLASAACGKSEDVSVQFDDVEMVGKTLEQRAGEALGADPAGRFVKWQVACRAPIWMTFLCRHS
jgi:hypothetical protein